jgi:predicted transcriptional regulator
MKTTAAKPALKTRKVMKQFGITYDGSYSHIVAIKNENEAEQHEVSEYYSTLSEAKKVLSEYLKDEIATFQAALKSIKDLKEEDF